MCEKKEEIGREDALGFRLSYTPSIFSAVSLLSSVKEEKEEEEEEEAGGGGRWWQWRPFPAKFFIKSLYLLLPSKSLPFIDARLGGGGGGGRRVGGGVLWFRIIKNPDVSTGPLTRLFAHVLIYSVFRLLRNVHFARALRFSHLFPSIWLDDHFCNVF